MGVTDACAREFLPRAGGRLFLDGDHDGQNRVIGAGYGDNGTSLPNGLEAGVGFVGVFGAALFHFDQFGILGFDNPTLGFAGKDVEFANFHGNGYFTLEDVTFNRGHVWWQGACNDFAGCARFIGLLAGLVARTTGDEARE